MDDENALNKTKYRSFISIRKYYASLTSDYVSTPEMQPYYDLWCWVIKQAIRDKDPRFFRSEWFSHICGSIGLDEEAVIYNLPKKLKKEVLDNQ